MTEYAVVKMFANSQRVADLIAVEILRGSNEKAKDILCVSGFKGLIAETCYTTMSEIVRFYGIKEKYIRGILSRYGFNKTETPDDVLYMSIYDFLKQNNIREDRYLINKNGETWRIFDKSADKYYQHVSSFVCSGERREHLYSAKLILAIAALMYYGRRIPDGSIALNLFERLNGTSYFREACERAAENRKKNIEASKTRSAEQQSNPSMPTTFGEVISLPVDRFIQVVVAAAQTLNIAGVTQSGV